MTKSYRYTVWLFDTKKDDYVCMPGRLKSLEQAYNYLYSFQKSFPPHPYRLYDTYIIKRQEVIVGDYHEVVNNGVKCCTGEFEYDGKEGSVGS